MKNGKQIFGRVNILKIEIFIFQNNFWLIHLYEMLYKNWTKNPRSVVKSWKNKERVSKNSLEKNILINVATVKYVERKNLQKKDFVFIW
jgi:hypothetical protein